MSVVCAIGLVACGRTGPIRPPQYVTPQPPSDIRVISEPNGLSIQFRRPDKSVDGLELSDLAYLELWRDCGTVLPLTRIARIPIIDRGSMRKTKSLQVSDAIPAIGETCRYLLIAETRDGYRSEPAKSTRTTRILIQPEAVQAP